MASDDKKKQAMSLLFGDAPAKPRGRPVPEAGGSEARAPSASPASEPTEGEAPAAEIPAEDASDPTGARDRGGDAERRREGRGDRGSDGGARGSSRAPVRAEENEHRDPYYEGQGRYRRKDGVRVKKSVYLDPDVWRAVSVAAAVGDDPRGSNASEIINTLLREAGYEG